MEPGTTVVGRLNINPFAPEKVNNEGEPQIIEEEAKQQARSLAKQQAAAPAAAPPAAGDNEPEVAAAPDAR
jgi:hypothetical protein